MRVRKILDVTFGGLVAVFAIVGLANAFFPRLHNDVSCDDSVPANPAQEAALKDARDRVGFECAAAHSRCKFVINDSLDADGMFRISPHVVEMDFFEGGIHKNDSLDNFIYDRHGKFVRTEEAPYALSGATQQVARAAA